MRKQDESFLVDLSLLNAFSSLMDQTGDLSISVVFLVMITHLNAEGTLLAGNSEELITLPAISVPIRNILTTPFFRQFYVIHYASLFRAWGNRPLFSMGLGSALLSSSSHFLNGFR